MKRVFGLLVSILLFIPIIVNAEEKISCNNNKVFDLDTCTDACNFTCSNIEGENVTFTHNNEDYSEYFQLDDDLETIEVIDKNIKFDSSFETGLIVISDGDKTGTISIKNKDYKPTTTTTTTKDPNIKEITVTLDPNNGGDTSTKTCNIVVGSNTCSITLPKLETTGFNGWGTASTCKEGNSGSIKVDKDTTYYACYNNRDEETQTETNTENTLFLESLEILDKDTNETINFGTYTRRKTEYEFKVLYTTENLDIKATATEGVEIEITGNESLVVGENEIIIKLTNDSNETSEYKLLVTRLNEGETINNTHYLKSLAVGGYNIDFNKETFIYNLTIPADVDRLEITAIKENDEDNNPEIKNNENLINGSKIEIIVTGKDDEPTIYTINIIKETKKNIILIIAVALIALLIIILLILIIVKSNKNKKNKNNVGPQTLNNNKNDIEVLNI